MSKVEVTKHIYNNPDTGEVVPYERLAISGYINGEPYTLEVKLSKTELQMVKALLTSEESHTESRKATQEEQANFLDHQKGFLDD